VFTPVSENGNETSLSTNAVPCQSFPTLAMRVTPQKEYPSTACLRHVVIEPRYPPIAALVTSAASGRARTAVQQWLAALGWFKRPATSAAAVNQGKLSAEFTAAYVYAGPVLPSSASTQPPPDVAVTPFMSINSPWKFQEFNP